MNFFPEQSATNKISSDIMQHVYEETKTPYKYGIVLNGEKGHMLDSPSIFRTGEQWYMMYIRFDGNGYETHLAGSSDLLSWKPLGVILSKGSNKWDSEQIAGYAALQNTEWGGNCSLQQFDGKYWLTYLGGALKGYETDPLSAGIAWTKTPEVPIEWTRHPHPVLTPKQPDVRSFETLTIYKSNVIYDDKKTLGHPFVMYYNAKAESGYERIGMAVSDDMITWKRFGKDPVIDNGNGISGDPQIVRIGDVWVMFYFGAFWRPKAFDTFACSYDLVHWTKWEGDPLVSPSEPWDMEFAHKPWIVKHNGIVYHFYCAVGNEGRAIALATSKELTGKKGTH